MKNTPRFLFSAALAAALCLTVFCTIKDDNGNPADPGSPAATDSTGINGGGNNNASGGPVIVVSPGQITAIDNYYYVKTNDSITLSVQLKTDTTAFSTGIGGGTVTVFRSDNGKTKTTYTISSGDSTTRPNKPNLTVKTDLNGLAVVNFKSTADKDTAELTFKHDSLETTVKIVVTSTPPSTMDISYSLIPNAVEGTTKCIVTVQVKNAFNNPVVGEIVKFSTDAGIITAEGVTDSEGKAKAELTGNSGDEFAIVTAYLKNDPTRNAEITVTFIEETGYPLKRIYFNKPVVEQAPNGSINYNITVLVKNNFNNPLTQEVVRFISTAGMIDAEATTDNRGKASVLLTSDWDYETDCANVTAFLASDTTCRESRVVCFTKITRNTMTVTANPASINKNGADTGTVIATLRDDANNPLVGERVTFTSKLGAVNIVILDSITNISGEARAKVVGTGATVGGDTIVASGGNATGSAPITFSENSLRIYPTANSPATTPLTFVANPAHTTTFTIDYRGTNGGLITNDSTRIEVSVTMGKKINEITFAEKILARTGRVTFTINNPEFTDTATIRATAYTESNGAKSEVVTKDTTQYFKASAVKHIEISVSPFVIGTNNGRTTITATAYDERWNRVQDEVISFNLLKAPGGGEYISPATAITLADGTAKSYLYAGSIPSQWQGVEVVASDFSSVRSNTVKLTIAGPPRYITVRRNMGEIVKYPATYGKQFSVLVSDVNGNPVADGTEVTFTAQITGYVYYEWGAKDSVTSMGSINISGAISTLIQSEWPGNPDNPYNPYPSFNDINRNGQPNRYPQLIHSSQGLAKDTDIKIEEFDFCKGCLEWSGTSWILTSNAYNERYIPIQDAIQYGVDDATSLENYLKALYEANPLSPLSRWHIDWNRNGVPDPSTTVLITRTAQTTDGIADNELVYGQSDALRIQVKVWAEAQGLVTSSPEQFILPLAEDAFKYWSYFE